MTRFSWTATCRGMDGYTAARQIRSRQRLQARIPIVALTANAIAGARTVEMAPLIGGGLLRVKLVGKILQDRFPILWLQRRAPAHHLVHFAIPLRWRESLLHHHALIVATHARGLVARRLRGSGGFERNVDHLFRRYLNIHALDGVPQVTRWIPFLRQRLSLSSSVCRARHDGVRAIGSEPI